jgi:UDP-glucose 4-epimerase
MRACITGGAGFIGSNLADELHARGWDVVVLDDFRTGRREFLENLLGQQRFSLIEGDVLDDRALREAVVGCDWVFHLQANADVRRGLEHPTRDLEQNTIATSRVLEAMRAGGVRRILFSSTGSVYGEPAVFPTPEDAPFPIQTSLYGASKLAGEGLLSAYAFGYGLTSVICRFVSVLGERYTHGHVFDFFVSLQRDPGTLRVLGDGKQEKSYMYIRDCVRAMLATVEAHEDPGVFVYNLGTDATVTVNDSVATICRRLSVDPQLIYSGGARGWIGDSPLIHLDTSKIRSLGWVPEVSIPDAIERTVEWLAGHDYVWRDLLASAPSG